MRKVLVVRTGGQIRGEEGALVRCRRWASSGLVKNIYSGVLPVGSWPGSVRDIRVVAHEIRDTSWVITPLPDGCRTAEALHLGLFLHSPFDACVIICEGKMLHFRVSLKYQFVYRNGLNVSIVHVRSLIPFPCPDSEQQTPKLIVIDPSATILRAGI